MSKALYKNFSDIARIVKGRSPGQLVIQYTDACNATCPQCEMSVQNRFKRSRLGNDKVKKIIDASCEAGIKAISFTGGEPFLYFEDLLGLIDYAGKRGIDYIRTGTNGFIFMNSSGTDFKPRIERMAEKLAKTRLRNFWISIDSAIPEIHERMRGLPGVIAGIEKALPIFHSFGIFPAANLGINRNINGAATADSILDGSDPDAFYDEYKKAFDGFYSFVKSIGFSMANACYPMSVDKNEGRLNPLYAATSQNPVVSFSRNEKIYVFKALFDTIPGHRSEIRIFTPRTNLFAAVKELTGNSGYSYPCRGGVDYFFISTKDCNAYPCGYRGDENLGRYWDFDCRKIKSETFCRKCEWECFRDPSELMGPLLNAFGRPLSTAGKFIRDKEYTGLWLEDIRYYRSCRFFNGRIPPDYQKLKKFNKKAAF